MILFITLALLAIVLTVITVVALVAGGAGAIIVFGDVIVCIVFIALIMKRIICRKR